MNDHEPRGRDTAPVAIITGAASGIGLAIARRLHRDGFRIAVCDLSPSLLTVFAEEIAAGEALAQRGNVGDDAFRASFVATVAREFGGIDTLVNNAATGGVGASIEALDLQDLRSTLEVNVVALVGMTQLALPHLKQSTRGRIINLASLFAHDPAPCGGDYSASKGAVYSLTRVMAIEFGPAQITCNAIDPGYILTPMHEAEVAMQAAARGVSVETRFAQLRAEVPVGRHGTGDDVAQAVAWLASAENSYVTGVNLSVNGGVSFA